MMPKEVREKPLEESLSLKQERWLDSYIKTGNASKAAKKAGYKSENGSLGVIGWENLKKLKLFIRQRLDAESFNDERVDIVTVQALDAMETRFFQHEGSVVSRRNVINWAVRLKAVDVYNRIQGRYQENLKISGTVDLVEMDEKRKARTRRQAQLDARMEIERSYKGG